LDKLAQILLQAGVAAARTCRGALVIALEFKV
jgi:hypothetical protein